MRNSLRKPNQIAVRSLLAGVAIAAMATACIEPGGAATGPADAEDDKDGGFSKTLTDSISDEQAPTFLFACRETFSCDYNIDVRLDREAIADDLQALATAYRGYWGVKPIGVVNFYEQQPGAAAGALTPVGSYALNALLDGESVASVTSMWVERRDAPAHTAVFAKLTLSDEAMLAGVVVPGAFAEVSVRAVGNYW